MRTRPSRSLGLGARRGIPATDQLPSPHTTNIPPALLDLVRLRVSQIHEDPSCIEKHMGDLRTHLVPEERIANLGEWRHSPWFDEKDRAALGLCEAITCAPDQPVPQEVLHEARRHFNEREMITLSLAILAVNDWNYLDEEPATPGVAECAA